MNGPRRILTALLLGLGLATAGFAQAPSPAVTEALSLPRDAARGKTAYQACESCHRADGAGRAGGEMPGLAGQHAEVTIRHLVDVRDGRRTNPDMKQALIDEPQTLQAIADVAEYLRALPPSTRRVAGPGSHLEQGRQLYERDCAECHGARAQGDAAKFAPAMAGQNYPFLWRELNLIQRGMRGASDPAMRRALRRYTPEQLHALADHLSHLAAPSR